jgi:hypothetical protein
MQNARITGQRQQVKTTSRPICQDGCPTQVVLSPAVRCLSVLRVAEANGAGFNCVLFSFSSSFWAKSVDLFVFFVFLAVLFLFVPPPYIESF